MVNRLRRTGERTSSPQSKASSGQYGNHYVESPVWRKALADRA
ncbi:hypothetical protein ABTX77_09500 [Streptomyces sp. NPDC097704]